MDGFFRRVHGVVAGIPSGRVMTYGQVAATAGNPRASRAVGYALRAIPEGEDIPWHRVVNASGEISPRRTLQGDDDRILQRILLESEGVKFGPSGRVDLKVFGTPREQPVP